MKENIYSHMLINEGCAYVGSLEKLNLYRYSINALIQEAKKYRLLKYKKI